MFDFSRSSIGKLDEGESEWSKRVGPESMYGITPEMRRSINLRDALEQGKEADYSKAAGGGATPLSLFLMDPERHYRRTGQSAYMNEGEPIWYTPGTPEARDIIKYSMSANAAGRSAKRWEEMDKMLKYSRESAYDPVATAAARIDPETARRTALIKSGYTKEYGDPSAGIPTGYEREIGKQREQNVPALKQVEAGMEQFEKLAPSRAETIRTSQATGPLKEREQTLETLNNTYKAAAAIAGGSFNDTAVAKARLTMDETLDQMLKIAGLPPRKTRLIKPPVGFEVELNKQHNPRNYSGDTVIITDAQGNQSMAKSDGKNWIPLDPASAIIPKSSQEQNQSKVRR